MDVQKTVPEKGGGIGMRRGWKIFWIVCGICAGVGLVCCALAFVMGVTHEAIENRFPNGIGIVGHIIDDDDDYDDDYDDDDDDDYDDDDDDDDYDGDDGYEDNGYPDKVSKNAGHTAGNGEVTNMGSRSEIVHGTGSQTFTGVNSIDAEVWGGYIEVVYDEAVSGEIRVETEDMNKKVGLKCFMDEDELEIVTRKKVVGLPGRKPGKLIIHVPKDYQFDEASISLAGGYLRIADIHASKLSVNVGAGEGIIENFTAVKAELECGAGSLTAAGTADKKAEIDCGVGEISYTAGGKEEDYNYKIDCGIGEIVCGEASFGGIGAEKKISNNAAKSMEISCGMGAVAVAFSEK